ncbi:PQQ-dependent sugar dehydrogenase [Caulobacter sp. 17J65-9]|uniref:PQQ-dependent sugar dehydrogenase n=1 Tax=Caulobacter sp. 17J65-9 TaxID=2709382 RepID=UPI0013C96A35|nr:PQQ-dependent sugar dehydrogenase [Caulobacter sp. 17J65-9]NEX92276.1 PQQ-dependent sugar dehydrogenase [Caulobacter sp. 17J65-9]
MGRWTAVIMTAVALAAVTEPGNPAQAQTRTVQSQAGPVSVETLARLDHPWGMVFLPDGGLLITEQPGRLRIWSGGRLSAPVSGVPAVAYRGQGGLLDVATDPGFAGNRLVYLSYVEAAKPQPPGLKETPEPRLGGGQDLSDNVLKGLAVARGRLENGALRDVQVIWRQTPKTVGRGAFGGRLVFAPDGALFITSGDRDRFEPAQDLNSNLGKIVRIRPDGSIPSDNPFVDRPGALKDIYSFGHRNPLGAAINPNTGELWAEDAGPEGGDRLVVVHAGHNYGWPLISSAPSMSDVAELDPNGPVYSWNPPVGPSSLAFYTGDEFPWRMDALSGALAGQTLIHLDLRDGEVISTDQLAVGQPVRDVVQDANGALLLLTDGPQSGLLRLTPTRK